MSDPLWYDNSFKHRYTYRNGAHTVSFWQKNTACIEDHAETAVVEVSRGPYTSRIELKWPDERPKLADLERMFEEIFERGRQQAKKEIRDLLGVQARS